MPTTEFVTWTQLSSDQQLDQWRSFLDALDAGDAGYHRFYAVLMPLWDRGLVPEIIDDEQLAKRDAELAEEARWTAEHPSLSNAGADDGIVDSDPCTHGFWDRFEPMTGERLWGCSPG